MHFTPYDEKVINFSIKLVINDDILDSENMVDQFLVVLVKMANRVSGLTVEDVEVILYSLRYALEVAQNKKQSTKSTYQKKAKKMENKIEELIDKMNSID